MKRLTWWSILVAFVLLVQATGSIFVRAQTPDTQILKRARQFVAARFHLPPDTLQLAHVTPVVDPSTGTRAFAVKILNLRTGLTYSLVLDDATVDAAADRETRWNAALKTRRRRVDVEVAARLTERPGDAVVPVIVWLKEQRSTSAVRPSARKANDAVDTDVKTRSVAAAIDAHRAAAVSSLGQGMVGRLKQRGRIARAHRFSPAVFAELSANDIQEMAAWPEVDHVYLDQLNTPEMSYARTSLKASIVNNRGYSGTGIRIAIVEVGGNIAASRYLELTRDMTDVCGSPTTHSTGVAGLINSNHPAVRGIAPGAFLWAGGSCGGNSSQLQNRATAAADWGARSINLSWGVVVSSLSPSVGDRFFDDMVLNRHVFVVKSAGNRSASVCGAADGKVTSPGLGYNVLTVGSYDDRNTTDWTDDVMDECSSYVDPTSTNGDREKPEVAAPGMNIDSTLTDGGVGNIGSGTSFSSGLVTGVAALLMQRAPTLQFWPESLKAILMATAIHNIEGDRRLSDRDGAGGLSVDRADDVARGFSGDWDGIGYECDANTPAAPLDVPLTLVGARRTRAAVVWDTDPDYELYAEQPGADLDIAVLDPSGTVVASSTSLDNTYELVDFVPATPGQYTLRITSSRCDMSPRYLGWAWWRAS